MDRDRKLKTNICPQRRAQGEPGPGVCTGERSQIMDPVSEILRGGDFGPH